MNGCNYQEPEGNIDKKLDLPEGVPPLRAFYLYLSNSCNLACRHCWITTSLVSGTPDTEDVIDTELLRGAIKEAKPMGLSNIKLTGGEPLLHPKFQEIVEMLTKEGLNLDLETNGTLITAELAHFLKNKSAVSFISISLDGSNPQDHDRFRGVKGAFQSALHGLDHLVAAGYDNIQVIMSVHHENQRQIEDVVRLAADHGASSVKFNPIIKSGRGIGMSQRGETLDIHQRIALNHFIYDELQPKLTKEGVDIDLYIYSPPALTPIQELFTGKRCDFNCEVLSILGILGGGEIALCGIGRNIPELVYGNLEKDSIRKIWLSHPTILQLRKDLDNTAEYPGICGKCLAAKLCRTGCIAQNFLESKQMIWPNFLCEKAEKHNLFPKTRKKPAALATSTTSG